MSIIRNFEWDAFISHASEDKASFVEPLVAELQKYGLKIWFDKFSLRVGSSLRQSIDEGLAESHYGVVVLSHAFFAKNWPKKEINGLFARQATGHDVILPVWHDLTKEDLLRYSPLLSDIVAVKSSEGMAAVARSLVQVMRPEAFLLETNRLDGQNAVARIRERLKSLHPQLDCRVTFGPNESDPPPMGGPLGPQDVVLNQDQDGTKIEVFAPDRAAYNSNPISFKLRMTKEAWEKLQDVEQKGKRVELGPEDILGLTSDLFTAFGPEPGVLSSGVQKFIVGPSPELMKRKFRFKLTFASGEESEEFQYVEFEMVRPGKEDVEIRSSSSALPFELTLIINLAGGPSGISVSYGYAGQEISKIYKAHRAIKLLTNGGTLEVFDLEADKKLPTFHGAQKTSPSSETDDYWGNFVEAAQEIAVALNDTLVWPEHPTKEDSIYVQLIREIVRTGRVSIPAETLTVTVATFPGVDLRDALGHQKTFRLNQIEPPEFATVFCKTLDLGPYSIDLKAREFEVSTDKDDAAIHVVKIAPAEPLLYQFEKFSGRT